MVSYVIYIEHIFGTSLDSALLKVEAALAAIAKVTHHITDRWIRCLVIFNSRLDGNSVAAFHRPERFSLINGFTTHSIDFAPLLNLSRQPHIPWHISIDYLAVTRYPSRRYIKEKGQYVLPDSIGPKAAKELLIKSAHMTFDQISAEAMLASDEITEVRALHKKLAVCIDFP